jgi:hypothetical protein
MVISHLPQINGSKKLLVPQDYKYKRISQKKEMFYSVLKKDLTYIND